MGLRRWAAGLAMLAILVGAGCGGSGDDSEPAAEQTTEEQTTEASRCAPIPGPARASIADSLRGNLRLGKGGAVQSTDSFGGPPPLSEVRLVRERGGAADRADRDVAPER
jgi:hypothetical protein